ncbi:MAG: hypothetical protein ACPGTU_19165, partial [Myxococcota bacterium]
MLWAEVLWGLIALVLILDAMRIRGRLMSIPLLGAARLPARDTHRFILAPGVELSASTREAAHAHLSDRGLEALDLVPGKLPLAVAWSIGCHVDPEAHRTDSLRVGDTAAHALLAPSSILDVLQTEEMSPDHATFVSLAGEVRRRVHACMQRTPAAFLATRGCDRGGKKKALLLTHELRKQQK